MKSQFFRQAYKVYKGLYSRRQSVTLAVYGGLAAIAYFIAYLLRFEFAVPTEYTVTIAITLPALILIRIGCDRAFRLSTERWRFVGTGDVVRLVAATTVGSLLFLALTQLLPLEPSVPRSVVLIEWVLSTYLVAALWIGYRTVFEQMRHMRFQTRAGGQRRAIIVGAGEAGALIAREMVRLPTGYEPIGFVDDNPMRRRSTVHGLPILGKVAQLGELVKKYDANEIIIATPSAKPEELRRIVESCADTELPYKVLPGIGQVLNGRFGLDQLREVRIEDLLGRDPIQLELPELAEDLGGRVVVITGAAGSIGSELARQVALHGPSELVLLDQSETELYYVELELRERHPDLKLSPIVCDITDGAGVERVFRRYRPDRVFHAAAYKHVSMMEVNVREAVRNNVLGTWKLTELSGRYGVGKFVLVSTDKAVQPTSVMGASKRMAELVVLEAQQRFPGTLFGAVRFGNVLGSRGSVIPIFKRQIRDGKPLTVTHPEATRYFMTIAEAVQLILQASLLPSLRGHIAMLDMGEAVRIQDLARNLLRLAGLPYSNGRVVYTGLRPGEKLHEELSSPEEDTLPTRVSKVRIIAGRSTADNVVGLLGTWSDALQEGRDREVISALCAMFPDLTFSQTDVRDSDPVPLPARARATV